MEYALTMDPVIVTTTGQARVVMLHFAPATAVFQMEHAKQMAAIVAPDFKVSSTNDCLLYILILI